MRVVSLLPSATEILFALGAGDDVVGVTSDCDFPAEARTRPVVSAAVLTAGLSSSEIDAQVRERLAAGDDLYRLDESRFAALRPDVIVTEDLCAVCAVDVSTVDEAIAALGCDAAVVTLDPSTLDDVLASIEVLGGVVGRTDAAERLVSSLRARLDAVARAVAGRGRPRLAVLEWTDPPFAAGHWVPDMVGAAGAESVVGSRGARSVPIEWSVLDDVAPDVVVVAPCGFHLEPAATLATELLASDALPRNAAVFAVDADAAFVRPGPRLIDGVEALAGIVHPEVVATRSELARYIGTTSANTKPSRSSTTPT